MQSWGGLVMGVARMKEPYQEARAVIPERGSDPLSSSWANPG